ncbi:hypothetical protein KM043_005545 [Ampulex compressa]|nr:hypothetical protein KM043_005545 [Ampulex compressa]
MAIYFIEICAESRTRNESMPPDLKRRTVKVGERQDLPSSGLRIAPNNRFDEDSSSSKRHNPALASDFFPREIHTLASTTRKPNARNSKESGLNGL